MYTRGGGGLWLCLIPGNSYNLQITKTPSDATEDIIYTSTDNSVASVTSNGHMSYGSAGDATITVSGALSGKKASRTVIVTAAPVVEKYLVIEKNLSEISDAGKKAQESSQKNLGLGKLATKDVITANDTGAVPVADKTLPAGTDLNAITEPGELCRTTRQSNIGGMRSVIRWCFLRGKRSDRSIGGDNPR
ncbi:Ig-like domain-containing protein [Serratia symbiotica]|uniref:Ig-like domain-containing protein n=1 Tax=Serratia symbiotica TaxID=138074 RepID=UPI0008FF9568|nr:Ig-like domain-containing protein [Serratia symbiotica]